MRADERLAQLSELFRQRHELYGDNYKRFGPIMGLLFPNGIHPRHVGDLTRLGLVVQVVGKLTRYCENFNTGGHPDSLDDMAVYAQMLQEVDSEISQAMAVAQAMREEHIRRQNEASVDPEVPPHLGGEGEEPADPYEGELGDELSGQEFPAPSDEVPIEVSKYNRGVEPSTMQMRDGRTLQEALDALKLDTAAKFGAI